MREAFEAALKKDPYDELTHRAFADWLSERGEDAEAEHHRLWTPEWQKAADWLEKFAEAADEGDGVRETFNAIIAAGHKYLDQGESSTIGGSYSGFGATNQMTTQEEIDSFWDAFATYTRREVSDSQRDSGVFTCCY